MVTAVRRALGACVLTLVARPADAEPSRAQLNWTAPEGCPGAELVQQRIERILNRPMDLAEGETLSVSAVVTPASETQPWSVTLESDNGQRRASRTLQAASCDELANATALFVAILIEPDIENPDSPLADAAPPAKAPAPPPPSPPDRPTIDRGAQPAQRVEEASAARWAIGGVVGSQSGLVPSWAFGLGAHGAFSWKFLRTSAGLSFWLPVRETVDEAETQGAELQLSAANAELCFRIETPTLIPALCSGGELALLRGKGFGPGVQPQSSSALFGSLTAGGALLIRTSTELSLLLDVDALLPLGERQFVLAGSDPALVHEPSAGFRLSCGAEWSL